jgi:hypothetical protein
MLQETLESAGRLSADMILANHLYTYVTDWLMALHIISIRGAWTDMDSDESLLVH